jgi:hypothetical protein
MTGEPNNQFRRSPGPAGRASREGPAPEPEQGSPKGKTALNVALDFIARGWFPLPIPDRSKNPATS